MMLPPTAPLSNSLQAPASRRALFSLSAALLAALLASCGGSAEQAEVSAQAKGRSAALAAPGSVQAVDWLQVPVLPDPLLDRLQPTADAHLKGMWSPVIDWPINAIHMVLLPSGKVLTYGTRAYDEDAGTGNQDGGTNVLWAPSLGTGTDAFTITRFATDPKRQLNSFCSSAALLSTGKLLSTGGFGGPYVENDRTSNSSLFSGEYSPDTNVTVDTGLRTADERWYSTMLTLPDGRPIVLGGMLPYAEASWTNPSNTNGLASMTPEVFTPGLGWSLLPGAYSTEAFGQYLSRSEFPHAWVAPNGEIFGLSSDKLWFLDPKGGDGQGSIRVVGTFKEPARGYRAGETAANLPNVGSSTSSAAMFAPGKALHVGGNGYWVVHDLPGSSAATVLDFSDGTVKVTETSPMANARRFFNATVLANGEVFVNAGTRFGNSLGDAVYAGEVWNPGTGRWTTMASAQKARMYHNTAGLLPNGTVLTAGGGNPAPTFNRNIEVFYPPYLFQQQGGVTRLAPRPTITAVDRFKVAHGGSIQALLGTSGAIREAALMGLTITTHGFNSGQRRVPLSFSQTEGRLEAQMPDANLAPPGYYMLVVVDDAGVPSKGVILAIGDGVAEPPVVKQPLGPVQLTSALLTPGIITGGVASYDPKLSVADALVSWDFGDGSAPTPFAANAPVTHKYREPGVYTVVLKMQGLDGLISTHSFLQVVQAKPVDQPAPRFSSAMAVENRADGQHQVWVANADHDLVSAVSLANGSRRQIYTGDQPESVGLASAGVLGVVNKRSTTVQLWNPATLGLIRSIALPYGSRPHGLVFSADGRTGYVALEALGQVARFDVSTGALLSPLQVGGAIRHLSISGDDKTLFASRFITPPVPGEETGTPEPRRGGGEVAVVNLSKLKLKGTIKLAQSRSADTAISGRGVPNYLGPLVLSPDSRRGLVPSKQDNIGRGQLRDGLELDFQNTVRAITSRVDVLTLTEVDNGRIDHDNASVASAAVFHPNGQYAFITLETSREVVALDVANGLQLFRVEVGFAPQAAQLSPDGRSLLVYNFMGRSVSVINLATLLDEGQRTASVTATWPTVVGAAPFEAGKRLFYDARDPRLARDGYMSCASCHNDGDADGRTWDMTQMGEGLRNTPLLRGRSGAAFGRRHWTGNFDEVQDFEGQIRKLAGGTGLMSDAQYFSGTVADPLGQTKAGRSADLDALAAYVNSLTAPEPSPYRNNGALTAAGLAGQTLFYNRQCINCHAPASYTNSITNRLENVGTLKASSGQRLGLPLTGLDVPSLIGAHGTAPYLHDGSAATLEAAVLAHTTLNLTWTPQEMANLVRFLQEVQ